MWTRGFHRSKFGPDLKWTRGKPTRTQCTQIIFQKRDPTLHWSTKQQFFIQLDTHVANSNSIFPTLGFTHSVSPQRANFLLWWFWHAMWPQSARINSGIRHIDKDLRPEAILQDTIRLSIILDLTWDLILFWGIHLTCEDLCSEHYEWKYWV